MQAPNILLLTLQLVAQKCYWWQKAMMQLISLKILGCLIQSKLYELFNCKTLRKHNSTNVIKKDQLSCNRTVR